MKKCSVGMILAFTLIFGICQSEATESGHGLAAGDYITFGNYEQDNVLDNGMEPIEWLVLDVNHETNRALIISRYGLDTKPYNTQESVVTWETCTLRAWLNKDFLQAAFSTEEQAAILVTKVNNGSKQGYYDWGNNSSNDTWDKVYLLSYAEAQRFFGINFWLPYNSEMAARVAPTAYAIAKGAYVSKSSSTADGQKTGAWWLRTNGAYREASFVYDYGYVSSHHVNMTSAVIRPVLWLSLRSYEDMIAKEHKNTDRINSSIIIGDYVTFGSYEQDNNTHNGKEPIEWIVLDYDALSNRALLISHYSLDTKPYNTPSSDVTWETCTLRAWLNTDFLSEAFSSDEQTVIVLTDVDNSRSQGYNEWDTDGGNNTQDKIFLLSYAEAYRYFGVGKDDYARPRVGPTAYAIAQGAYTYSKTRTAEGDNAGAWWLRSPGVYPYFAAYIDINGALGKYGTGASGETISVRPALWVELDPEFFQ